KVGVGSSARSLQCIEPPGLRCSWQQRQPGIQLVVGLVNVWPNNIHPHVLWGAGIPRCCQTYFLSQVAPPSMQPWSWGAIALLHGCMERKQRSETLRMFRHPPRWHDLRKVESAGHRTPLWGKLAGYIGGRDAQEFSTHPLPGVRDVVETIRQVSHSNKSRSGRTGEIAQGQFAVAEV